MVLICSSLTPAVFKSGQDIREDVRKRPVFELDCLFHGHPTASTVNRGDAIVQNHDAVGVALLQQTEARRRASYPVIFISILKRSKAI